MYLSIDPFVDLSFHHPHLSTSCVMLSHAPLPISPCAPLCLPLGTEFPSEPLVGTAKLPGASWEEGASGSCRFGARAATGHLVRQPGPSPLGRPGGPGSEWSSLSRPPGTSGRRRARAGQRQALPRSRQLDTQPHRPGGGAGRAGCCRVSPPRAPTVAAHPTVNTRFQKFWPQRLLC